MHRRFSAWSSSSTSVTIGSESNAVATDAASGFSSTFLALNAYFRVCRVTSDSVWTGLTHASICVLALPPKELCISRVSELSRYGTLSDPSAKALITRPSTNKPMLVPTPAASTDPPCERSIDSAPARSTRVSRAIWVWNLEASVSPTSRQRCSTLTTSKAWDRLEWAWTPVAAVALALAPAATTSRRCSQDFILSSSGEERSVSHWACDWVALH